mgnify:CR=1 FL=1
MPKKKLTARERMAMLAGGKTKQVQSIQKKISKPAKTKAKAKATVKREKPTTYAITLTNAKLGLTVEVAKSADGEAKKYLRIKNVDEACEAADVVRNGDTVISCNGESAFKKIVKALKTTNRPLNIELETPAPLVEVTSVRGGRRNLQRKTSKYGFPPGAPVTPRTSVTEGIDDSLPPVPATPPAGAATRTRDSLDMLRRDDDDVEEAALALAESALADAEEKYIGGEASTEGLGESRRRSTRVDICHEQITARLGLVPHSDRTESTDDALPPPPDHGSDEALETDDSASDSESELRVVDEAEEAARILAFFEAEAAAEKKEITNGAPGDEVESTGTGGEVGLRDLAARLFRALDEDNDGRLSTEEASKLFDADDWDDIISGADEDSDGLVDEAEWIDYVVAMGREEGYDDAIQSFTEMLNAILPSAEEKKGGAAAATASAVEDAAAADQDAASARAKVKAEDDALAAVAAEKKATAAAAAEVEIQVKAKAKAAEAVRASAVAEKEAAEAKTAAEEEEKKRVAVLLLKKKKRREAAALALEDAKAKEKAEEEKKKREKKAAAEAEAEAARKKKAAEAEATRLSEAAEAKAAAESEAEAARAEEMEAAAAAAAEATAAAAMAKAEATREKEAKVAAEAEKKSVAAAAAEAEAEAEAEATRMREASEKKAAVAASELEANAADVQDVAALEQTRTELEQALAWCAGDPSQREAELNDHQRKLDAARRGGAAHMPKEKPEQRQFLRRNTGLRGSSLESSVGRGNAAAVEATSTVEAAEMEEVCAVEESEADGNASDAGGEHYSETENEKEEEVPPVFDAEDSDAELSLGTLSSSSSSFSASSSSGEEEEEEAQAPLPEGWCEHHDATHNTVFYHNSSRRESTWLRPVEDAAMVLSADDDEDDGEEEEDEVNDAYEDDDQQQETEQQEKHFGAEENCSVRQDEEDVSDISLILYEQDSLLDGLVADLVAVCREASASPRSPQRSSPSPSPIARRKYSPALEAPITPPGISPPNLRGGGARWKWNL